MLSRARLKSGTMKRPLLRLAAFKIGAGCGVGKWQGCSAVAAPP